MIQAQHKRVMDEIERCALAAGSKFMTLDYPTLSDELKACVEQVNYFCGHRLEVVNEIKERDKDPDLRKAKFPLIALFTDISIQHGKYGEYDGALLQMVIAHRTEREYTTDERILNSFDPYLRPIFNRFMNELYTSGVFAVVDEETDLKCNAIERFFWGRNGLYGNVGSVFNEYVDAIELNNLDIKLHKNC